MTLEEALSTYLRGHAGFAAAVAGRIYPNVLPQAPRYPCVRFLKISGTREHSHDGPSGLASPRIQFDVFDRDHARGVRAAEALRLALDGYRGSMPPGEVPNALDVNGAFLEDEDDGYDDELQVHVRRMDFFILHNEATQ